MGSKGRFLNVALRLKRQEIEERVDSVCVKETNINGYVIIKNVFC
jgi:hypothetical protein